MEDFVWTDGSQEKVTDSFDAACTLWEFAGKKGKVWHRRFSEDGLLEGVTDVTPRN